MANIPEIKVQAELIDKILHTNYIDNCGINEFEEIRKRLRNLMKHIRHTKLRYDTNFEDNILDVSWNESELENDDLKNYKAKAEYYIRKHQDNEAIKKLKSNIPLSHSDIVALQKFFGLSLALKKNTSRNTALSRWASLFVRS